MCQRRQTVPHPTGCAHRSSIARAMNVGANSSYLGCLADVTYAAASPSAVVSMAIPRAPGRVVEAPVESCFGPSGHAAAVPERETESRTTSYRDAARQARDSHPEWLYFRALVERDFPRRTGLFGGWRVFHRVPASRDSHPKIGSPDRAELGDDFKASGYDFSACAHDTGSTRGAPSRQLTPRFTPRDPRALMTA
jgi:hypothetical protein